MRLSLSLPRCGSQRRDVSGSPSCASAGFTELSRAESAAAVSESEQVRKIQTGHGKHETAQQTP